ncbi:MAG: ABC transporter permease [Anaerolineae bacterium]
MSTPTWHGREGARIIWAIAAKDVVDAVRNKTLQGIAIGVLLLVLSGRALPLLAGRSSSHAVIVYDEGQSRLVAALQKRDELHLSKTRSLQEMKEAVSGASVAVLGLHLPAGLDQALEAGQPSLLEATAVHWADQEDVAEIERAVERALGEITGRPVEVSVAEERLYPDPDGGGFTSLAAGLIGMVVVVVGIAFVPHLFAEEKETQTLQVLLVSPASTGQVVAGKALAGAAYCLAGGGAAMALNSLYVVHWEAALLSLLCGTALAVALGLLLGVLFGLPQQMSAAGALLMGALVVATFLADMVRLPAFLLAVLRWVPTVAMAHALRLSFAESAPAGWLAADLGAVLGAALLVYLLVAWRIRQIDR